MTDERLSNDIAELARKIEQMENTLFFMNESLESILSRSAKADKTQSHEHLSALAYDVSRLLPKAITIVSNTVIDTNQISNQLYDIYSEVEDLEIFKKKSL